MKDEQGNFYAYQMKLIAVVQRYRSGPLNIPFYLNAIMPRILLRQRSGKSII